MDGRRIPQARDERRRTGLRCAVPGDVSVPDAVDARDFDDVALAVGGSDNEKSQHARLKRSIERGAYFCQHKVGRGTREWSFTRSITPALPSGKVLWKVTCTISHQPIVEAGLQGLLTATAVEGDVRVVTLLERCPT